MDHHGFGGRGLGRWLTGLDEWLWGTGGQSTTEFLLVAMALVSMAVGLAAMWHAAESGRLLSLASAAASHSSESGVVSLLKDLAGY